jgi:chaperonin GroEL (HSP60 family)
MEEPTFQILNANRGRTNIVPDEEREGLMVDTAVQILELLQDHCGPYARFAMISDNARPDLPPKFTTDGINIVRSIQYHNPMQRIIRDELAYLGSKIESVAGDGTTTSMIIAAKLYLLLNKPEKLVELGIAQPSKAKRNENIQSYTEFTAMYKDLLVQIKEGLDKCTHTYKDLHAVSEKEAIRTVARWQAMTSSHGDEELSDEIADVFAAMPPEAWRNIVFVQETHETEKLVFSTVEDDQYVMSGLPVNGTIMNKSAGTEYHQDKVNVFVLHNPLAHMDILSTTILTQAKAICDDEHNPEPVAIICPAGIDATTIDGLAKILSPNFAVFTHRSGGQQYDDLKCLQAVAGQFPTMSSKQVKPFKASLSYANHELKFNNVYEVDETSQEHPDVNKQDTPVSAMLKDLDLVIDKIQTSGDKRPLVQKDLKHLQRMANKIRYRVNYVVHVGGSSRDNAYALDVVTDVLLAVKNSLVHGFVPAGNIALYYVLSELLYPPNLTHSQQSKPAMILLDGMRNAVQYQLKHLFPSNMLFEQIKWEGRPLQVARIRAGSVDYNDFDTLVEGTQSSLDNWPIQPANIEYTVLHTFGDTFIKYLYTKRIIAQNSIYVKDTPKPEKKQAIL